MAGVVNYEQLNSLLKAPVLSSTDLDVKIEDRKIELANLMETLTRKKELDALEEQIAKARDEIAKMGIIVKSTEKSVETTIADVISKPKTFSDIAAVKSDSAKPAKKTKSAKVAAIAADKSNSDKSAASEKPNSEKTKEKRPAKSSKKDESLAAIVIKNDKLKICVVKLGGLLYMTAIDKLKYTIPKSSGGFGSKRYIQGPGYEIDGQTYSLTFHVADQGANSSIGIIERDGVKMWVLAEYDSEEFVGFRSLTPILGTYDFQIGELNKEADLNEIMFPFNYAEFVQGDEGLHGIWAAKSVLDMFENPDEVWNARLA